MRAVRALTRVWHRTHRKGARASENQESSSMHRKERSGLGEQEGKLERAMSNLPGLVSMA